VTTTVGRDITVDRNDEAFAASAGGMEPAVAELLAEVARLRERAVRYEAERERLRSELQEVTLERDTARLSAQAHAQTTVAVREAMEELVGNLRAALTSLRATHDPRPDGADPSGVSELSSERDDLRYRLAEIEGSRAWAAIKFYRSVRLRVMPRW
jgi:hypothetical protein